MLPVFPDRLAKAHRFVCRQSTLKSDSSCVYHTGQFEASHEVQEIYKSKKLI